MKALFTSKKKQIVTLLFLGFFLFTCHLQKVNGADLVIVINTLECSNYYRSAPLLTELKKNFDIRFIFPEYESRIAVKYLEQKFNLGWQEYQVEFNDSLYNAYRTHQTSECVYFPNGSTRPLVSFPLSQLAMSFDILTTIPGKVQVDTIPIDPRFLFTGDMSFTFDSTYLYILEAQFGSLLQFNIHTHQQTIINLADSLSYETVRQSVFTADEINHHNAIEKGLGNEQPFIQKGVNFHHLTCAGKYLLIQGSIEYYKMPENNKVGIYTRSFILKINPFHLHEREMVSLPIHKDFYYAYAPAFMFNDTMYLPIGIQPSMHLAPNKKYILAKYVFTNHQLSFVDYSPQNVLPEEYTRLAFNYNFLNYSTYKNYFSFPFTKTIYHVTQAPIPIQLLPEVDTVAGSKIPDVKTNYLKMSFAVEYPIINFIARFDGGKVKLFSYDCANNLPFNQIELPVKIKTAWPNEDFFKFISINSFVHINLRNQYLVKYYW